jgi:hypothetical protein
LLEFTIEGARFAGFLIAAEEEIDQDGQDQCFEHGFRVGATPDNSVGGWVNLSVGGVTLSTW